MPLLYHFHELRKHMTTPLRMAADMQAQMLRHPANPLSYTMGGKTLAAACELFENSARPYLKPTFRLDHTLVAGRKVKVGEQVIDEGPFCRLLEFSRKGSENDPKLLIVAPMSGHFATLLRDTVAAFLPDHRVYITDWRDAREVPLAAGGFDLDDYIDHVSHYMDFLGPNLHVLAVCQPSVPVLAAIAIMAQNGHPIQPKSLTLMGGPVDTRISPTAPNHFAKRHDLAWIEQHLTHLVPVPYSGLMRRVYPGFLQLSGFMAMNFERHLSAQLKQFSNLVSGDGDSIEVHRQFYDEYLAVMDLPAEYYLQTVQRVFQDHDLAVGQFRYRGTLVEPAAIENCALMTIEGGRDDISAPGQTKAAHDLLPNLPDTMRDHWLQEDVGHYGVFNGRRWRDVIAPKMKAFMARHDDANHPKGRQTSKA